MPLWGYQSQSWGPEGWHRPRLVSEQRNPCYLQSENKAYHVRMQLLRVNGPSVGPPDGLCTSAALLPRPPRLGTASGWVSLGIDCLCVKCRSWDVSSGESWGLGWMPGLLLPSLFHTLIHISSDQTSAQDRLSAYLYRLWLGLRLFCLQFSGHLHTHVSGGWSQICVRWGWGWGEVITDAIGSTCWCSDAMLIEQRR